MRGYSAFAVFGVSATDINTTFDMPKSNEFASGSITSCPAGEVNNALHVIAWVTSPRTGKTRECRNHTRIPEDLVEAFRQVAFQVGESRGPAVTFSPRHVRGLRRSHGIPCRQRRK